MTPGTAYRILVIDDTESIHHDFRKILEPAKAPASPVLNELASSIFGNENPDAKVDRFVVESAHQGEEGAARVKEALHSGHPYSLCFVDMRMPPGWDGLETVRHLIEFDPNLQIVLCTAFSDHAWEAVRKQIGNTDNLLILKKPFEEIEVLQLAHTMSKKWSLHQSLKDRIASLDQLARRRTQELFRAEELFAQAFNASPLALCIQSLTDGSIVEVNTAFERVFNVSRLAALDRTPETFGRGMDPQRWQALLDRLHRGESIDEESVIYSPEGEHTREMRYSGRSISLGNLHCVIWVIRDVTEQIRLEQQLRQSQKMEAVGQLVSGVAHDFNNLLTIILNYAGLCLEQSDLPNSTSESLEKVRGAASRAAALTRQLLVFSRQQLPNPLPLDMTNVILSFQEMLTRLIPARIDLSWDCPPNLPIVRADEANIEQVVLNLVVNARDAIPREGRISISLASHLQPATANPERPPGTYLRLSVEDTGSGIPPQVLSRIFDPFFTTKDVGKGTGMGLATVDSIAKQHHGWVDVSSIPGKGSRFDVFLPADPAFVLPKEELPHSPTDDLLSNLRILYVEDDPIVRQVTQTILKNRCLRLEVAPDGAAALTAWESSSGEVDLLITDMIMPGGISGADLTRQFCKDNPQLKVLITSGYSPQLLTQSESLAAGLRVLNKPYDREMLMEAIQETLDDPRPTPQLA